MNVREDDTAELPTICLRMQASARDGSGCHLESLPAHYLSEGVFDSAYGTSGDNALVRVCAVPEGSGQRASTRERRCQRHAYKPICAQLPAETAGARRTGGALLQGVYLCLESPQFLTQRADFLPLVRQCRLARSDKAYPGRRLLRQCDSQRADSVPRAGERLRRQAAQDRVGAGKQ